jgi:Carboxypeptidase regulatory-like domain/TonB-dependent Receptor Plug Domain
MTHFGKEDAGGRDERRQNRRPHTPGFIAEQFASCGRDPAHEGILLRALLTFTNRLGGSMLIYKDSRRKIGLSTYLSCPDLVKLFAMAFAVAMVLLMTVREAKAQTLYGSIVGAVTDANGAVVPGAAITATETQTNDTRTTTTNDSGDYQLSTVPAGSYTVTITKAGFRVTESKNILVTINATARVDAKLTVGTQTETVTVAADTAVLETDRIDVHANISSEELEQLPQPTRTYEGMLGLLPGVAPPNPQWAGGGGTNNPDRSMIVNVNGTGASGTAVSVDGVAAYNAWVQFYSTAVPSTDAIETVNTVTASSGADQGIMAGAGIRIQIKSGTNNLHGSAYWTNVNNALKAEPYFVPSGTRKPKYIDNDMGGTIGGPIVKNKLFYFASYEGDFLREAQGGLYTLPTPEMTKGILASPTPIFDPATGNSDGSGRTLLPQDANGNYIISPQRISSVASTLLSHLPSGVPDGVYSNNLYINTPYLFDLQKVDSKVNWNATSKLSIAGRFSTYPYNNKVVPALGTVLGPGNGSNTDQHGSIYSTSVMSTYVASPNLVIDGVFGFTATNQYLFPPLYTQLYGEDTLKIPNSNIGPLPSAGGVPEFRFQTGNLATFGAGYPALSYKDPIFQYTGNVTWVRGRHSIRAGIDIMQQHMNHQEVTQTYMNFNGGLTGVYCPPTATPATDPNCFVGGNLTPPNVNQFNSFADFLLGTPHDASNSEITENWITLRSWTFAPYFSDTWQVTHKLTAYIGTGWDYLPEPHHADRGFEYYDATKNQYELCGVGGLSETCGTTTQKYLFAPRAGFAYRVTPNTVLRAGYSLAPEQINEVRDGLYNYPATITQTLNGANFNITPVQMTNVANGFPLLNAPTITAILPLPTTIGVTTPAKNFKRGYSQSYNFTVQRELPWNLLAQVGYVGTLTVDSHTRYDVNHGDVPGLGAAGEALNVKYGITSQMFEVLPLEHMNYKSFQAQIQKRFENGLQFMAGYTLSRWMGICCDEQGDDNMRILIPKYFDLNRALMPDDRTHNFEMSAIYELPFGKGKQYANTGAASTIAGGWQTNWTLSRYSGTPFTVNAPGDTLNAPGNSQTADQVSQHVAIYGARSTKGYFDTTAFKPVSELASFGTAPINSLRGPGYFNTDFSLFRSFPIRESLKMQIRGEALNLFNHPNFNNPDSGVTDGSGYGTINSTNAGSRLIAERFFRLGMKLIF